MEDFDDDDAEALPWHPTNVEDELERFRKDWLKELKVPPKQNRTVVEENNQAKPSAAHHEPSVEEQATFLYLQGAQAEQRGTLSEAIVYYRRAVQLVPDIDVRAEQLRQSLHRRERAESEGSANSDDTVTEEDDELSDLVQHFARLGVNRQAALCSPETPKAMMHISALPQELIMTIVKWIVSSDLDVLSLSQFALVCRGFYMCAMDEELWRMICRRVWRAKCADIGGYGTFRNMFISRPHVKWNGCYIGKVSYYREGEPSLDMFYRPYHLVEYYRYVRFFPSGEAVMVSSLEEPLSVIPQLKVRGSRLQSLMYGHYRFEDDLVTVVVKKRKINVEQYSRPRKNRAQDVEKEQTYHVEFVLQSVGCRPNSRIVWNSYTAYNLANDGKPTEFELTKKHYPAMIFSHVRSYVASSDAPLASTPI